MWVFLDIKVKMKKYFILFFILFSFPTFADSMLDNNIIKISYKFLEKPYALGPLGEEKGIDSDPLYREDKFDCLTFVETVLAKLYSKDENIVSIMNKIRYKNGFVSFETRNHFQNPDWIRNNKDIVENVSNNISKSVLKKNASKSIINLDKKSWFKKNYNIDVNIQTETVSLDFIRLDDFKNNMEKFISFIDKPYIFMTVINDNKLKEKIGTEADVLHTGFLIKKNDKLYLRHASSVAGKVVDNDFEKYIEKIQKNPKYLGFSLLEIKD